MSVPVAAMCHRNAPVSAHGVRALEGAADTDDIECIVAAAGAAYFNMPQIHAQDQTAA